MGKVLLKVALCSGLLALAPAAAAQDPGNYQRLPRTALDLMPPAQRVSGELGEMRIIDQSCPSHSLEEARRRIVNAAVQEWAFFGFHVEDLTNLEVPSPSAPAPTSFRRFRLGAEEAIRVADTIAGYWAVIPGAGWILQRQNENWNIQGDGARWRDFWSAAFISWLMCEGGLDDMKQFHRAIAHYKYIDQAIRARDSADSQSAFVAYNPGEAQVVPGDLLCRGSRPEYATLDQRRRQIDVAARTHCDIVVATAEEANVIKTIGGNVRGLVRMKLLPAAKGENGVWRPIPYGARRIFAHLKLKAPAIEADALDNSPTMQSRHGAQGN